MDVNILELTAIFDRFGLSPCDCRLIESGMDFSLRVWKQ